jgi:Protein of unknown function (DUF2809)
LQGNDTSDHNLRMRCAFAPPRKMTVFANVLNYVRKTNSSASVLRNTLTFKKGYFIAAILLFGIEVCIALYAHDEIIRPYVGDFLVVILLYCMVKAFVNASTWKIGLAVLIFSYFIETMQFFNIVHRLGLQHSRIASVVLGTSFEWTDLLMYTLGIAAVFLIEKARNKTI